MYHGPILRATIPTGPPCPTASGTSLALNAYLSPAPLGPPTGQHTRTRAHTHTHTHTHTHCSCPFGPALTPTCPLQSWGSSRARQSLRSLSTGPGPPGTGASLLPLAPAEAGLGLGALQRDSRRRVSPRTSTSLTHPQHSPCFGHLGRESKVWTLSRGTKGQVQKGQVVLRLESSGAQPAMISSSYTRESQARHKEQLDSRICRQEDPRKQAPFGL